MSKSKKIASGTEKLNVFLRFSDYEIEAGTLVLLDRKIYFKYNNDFLTRELDLSPFKLKYDGQIQEGPTDPFRGLFGLFDDSLPDGWGMLLLNRALGRRGLSPNDINALDRLAYIGESGKGALIYRPAVYQDKGYDRTIDLDNLKLAMDEVYRGTSDDVIDELFALGGSSGGARPKANLGYNSITNELIHGHSILPEGFKHWIVKFPGSGDFIDIANIEYAYYLMALEAGIEMSECKLLQGASGKQVFATKRFDRDGNNRFHMHSMAGLTHDNFRISNVDYGHIIDVAYRLEKVASARERILRLAAFNVYSHNRDDHSKNFSWLMNETGTWTFAPAYDLTYSSSGLGEHSTTVDGEGANPGRTQILNLASQFSIAKPNQIIDAVHDSLSNWSRIAEECGVTAQSIAIIEKSINQLKD